MNCSSKKKIAEASKKVLRSKKNSKKERTKNGSALNRKP